MKIINYSVPSLERFICDVNYKVNTTVELEIIIKLGGGESCVRCLMHLGEYLLITTVVCWKSLISRHIVSVSAWYHDVTSKIVQDKILSIPNDRWYPRTHQYLLRAALTSPRPSCNSDRVNIAWQGGLDGNWLIYQDSDYIWSESTV